MSRRFVTDLKDGDVVEEAFLVADKQLRANRNAALYLSVDLRDRTGVINGRMWNVTEETCAHVQTGGFVRVKGKVQLFQGSLQLILTHCDSVPLNTIDAADFESMTSQKIEELLLAGIFLHDLGKTRELSSESGFVYTDEGQLLGHLVIGVEMLTDKIRQTEQLSGEPFPEELALRLKHMILSHHGQYEFGSPRLPMTPEAVALHMLDSLDARLHEFTRAIQDDTNSASHWTLFIPRLDRKIFKGSK
jgi:23S rRNA maturation-related 3'-5' exoribonuclease YhaM